MATAIRDVLRRQFDTAWALTDLHLKDLSTEECLWRPADVGLHVHRGADGRWRADWPEHEGYDLGPSSIGWLTWHLVFWWTMVLDQSFGEGEVSRDQILWPGSAEEVRATVTSLGDQWRAELECMSDAELMSMERSRWPKVDCAFHDIVAWVNVELVKSAAEIGYVRFLYAARMS